MNSAVREQVGGAARGRYNLPVYGHEPRGQRLPYRV